MDGTLTGADSKTSTPTSAGTSEVFTKQQVAERERTVRSDALADLGRLKKSNETLQVQVAQLQKEQQEREEELAKDEPDKLTTIRTRSQLRAKDSELAAIQQELNEAKAKLTEYSTKDQETAREKAAREVAGRVNVDAVLMAKLAKFTDGSTEAMEEIARTLPKLGNPPPRRHDSNISYGGGTKTPHDIRQEYIQGKINTVKYAEEMRALGVEP